MFAQYQPGNPESERHNRIKWFKQCLNYMILAFPRGSTYAMPYGIGCGLAGGNMDEYMRVLEKWARNSNVGHLTLYRID